MADLTRRQLLQRGGAGLAALTTLAACTPTPAAVGPVPTRPPTRTAVPEPDAHAGMEMGAGQAGATPTLSAREQADQMDAMHEEGVKFFVDNVGKDPLFWSNPMPFETDGEVKVFRVTCTEMAWDVADGQTVNAMAYNGVVPGPEIRITEGERVRMVVTNAMRQSTAVHFHGVITPNSMDGVPFITQPPIKPGDTFTYEFVARNPGSHMYHSHHNAAEQVTRGLMGAFIIEPKNRAQDGEFDAEYTMILNDTNIGLTINGRSFPYTQPILAKLGDRIRVRYMNEGLMIHPMHLHGMPQSVFAKDGWTLPQPFLSDTLNVAPGERWDVAIDCTEPGVWAFHCHILTHAESPHGMFGMVTALIVQE